MGSADCDLPDCETKKLYEQKLLDEKNLKASMKKAQEELILKDGIIADLGRNNIESFEEYGEGFEQLKVENAELRRKLERSATRCLVFEKRVETAEKLLVEKTEEVLAFKEDYEMDAELKKKHALIVKARSEHQRVLMKTLNADRKFKKLVAEHNKMVDSYNTYDDEKLDRPPRHPNPLKAALDSIKRLGKKQ